MARRMRWLVDILTVGLNLLPSGTAGVDQFLRWTQNDGTCRFSRVCSFSSLLFSFPQILDPAGEGAVADNPRVLHATWVLDKQFQRIRQISEHD